MLFCFWLFLVFLGLHPRHMEVPRLGVKSELHLHLPAYTTATAMWVLSHNLHWSSRQCRILYPLNKTGDQTRVLMGTSRVSYHWATRKTLTPIYLFICWPHSWHVEVLGPGRQPVHATAGTVLGPWPAKPPGNSLCNLFIFFFFFFFCLFRATLMAYGGSQARGLIGAVAASLCQSHSNAGSELRLWPTPKLTATPDP